MKKILIVIDMQKDFVVGSLANKEAQKITPNVVSKINDFLEHKSNQDVLIFTHDTHYENYMNTLEGKKLPVPHCIINTDGWKLVDELSAFSDMGHHIKKYSFGYDGWKDTFESLCGGIEQDDVIELVGVCTDICVVSNALFIRALYPNNKIVVDASCCAGTTVLKHNETLDVMESCQIDVIR